MQHHVCFAVYSQSFYRIFETQPAVVLALLFTSSTPDRKSMYASE